MAGPEAAKELTGRQVRGVSPKTPNPALRRTVQQRRCPALPWNCGLGLLMWHGSNPETRRLGAPGEALAFQLCSAWTMVTTSPYVQPRPLFAELYVKVSLQQATRG